MRHTPWSCLLLLLFVLASLVRPGSAAVPENIPPRPTRHFNDYANVVSPATADELDATLDKFERDTSNNIRVVAYPKMLSPSSLEDYTVRVANAWRIGSKEKNNGTILFVFIADKNAFIQVGYGLEGTLPDATCKRIIDESLVPAFKVGNYEAGFRAAISGILAATKDEYKGPGESESHLPPQGLIAGVITAIGGFILLGLLLLTIHFFGGTFYQHHVRSLTFAENVYLFFLNMSLNLIFSAGSSSSSSGGGGGSSSSSGGSFGGGGAGGSW